MAGGSSDRDTSDGIPSEARSGVRAEIQTFLTTRRARISPEQAGLPAYGGERRRVSGLRRDEVAHLAGISSQYYTKLERGNATGISESVIDGIARALQPPGRVRATVQRVLDSMIGTPAFVLSGRLDILTANQLGFALFSPIYTDPVRPPNAAPVRLPRPVRHRVLPRLEQGRRRHGRPVTRRGWPPPLRPATFRLDWRAVHPHQRVSWPVGRERRSDPHHRC